MESKFLPVLIEIKPSLMLLGEVGLFARRDLEKGQIIGESELMGESLFIPWSDLNKFDLITQNTINSFCLGNKDGFSTLNNLNYMSLPWFMNHSCDGNVGFDKNDNFITLRKIKKGDELSWDYGTGESNPAFKMNCVCGSKKCRKIVTGDDWKSLRLNKEKKEYMMSDLR